MEKCYQEIIDFVLDAGKRLVEQEGKIKDIGVTKESLTEEDLRIERGLKEIILKYNPEHTLFAEEENDTWPAEENIWVIDPISGTYFFINGTGEYTIVVSHLYKGQPIFALVYHPRENKLYTAYKGKGAFLNSKKITVNNTNKEVVFKPSRFWKDGVETEDIKRIIENNFVTKTVVGSMALGYCCVATGECGGVISLVKDTFPEMAGSLIVKEAGGEFTNFSGGEINYQDRKFVVGNKKVHSELLGLLKK